jgi:hypothetical protein
MAEDKYVQNLYEKCTCWYNALYINKITLIAVIQESIPLGARRVHIVKNALAIDLH